MSLEHAVSALGERVASTETKLEMVEKDVIEVKEDVNDVAKKIDKLLFWVLTTFGGVIVSLIFLVINILRQQPVELH